MTRFRTALLVFAVGFGCCLRAHAQVDEERTFPLAKLEFGAGWSPLGVGNGLSVRGAVAVFPTRLGLIARVTAHTSARGTRPRLISLEPPERRIVDRAVMLAGRIDTDLDANLTVALGVGQLWGERLNADNNALIPLAQQFGIAAEIGAYMPTRHSGIGTVIMANVNGDAYVVGFVFTVFVGM